MEKDTKQTPLTNLKKLRHQSGETLKQLSNDTGISYSALSAYERGVRKPKYEQLETLANHFNVSIAYLKGESPYKLNEFFPDGIDNSEIISSINNDFIHDANIFERILDVFEYSDAYIGLNYARTKGLDLSDVDKVDIVHMIRNIFSLTVGEALSGNYNTLKTIQKALGFDLSKEQLDKMTEEEYKNIFKPLELNNWFEQNSEEISDYLKQNPANQRSYYSMWDVKEAYSQTNENNSHTNHE